MTDSPWTWQYLLSPQNAPIPAGVGFGTFTPIHLGVLALLAIGIAALVVSYRASGAARRHRIRLVFGWIILSLEAIRQIVYIATGVYDWSYLPLHACAVATIAAFIDALHTNRWTRELLYALGLWGATMALAFPDWSNLPILNVWTWQAFAIHACLIGYTLMLLVAGDLVPDWRNLWRVVIVMLVAVPVSVIANNTLGTNFWFLAQAAPGSPLEPIQSFAGAYYIPFLIALLVVLWAALYLPWELVRRHRRPRATSRAALSPTMT